MNSPVSNPKLPAWIFIATDAALIAAAGFVAMNSPQPLPANAMFAIVGLVALGAIVGLVPLVAAYERQKNEALDDRQRALEALARTVSTSAEQISIAAGGLNEIAETAQRSARHAEQLPHKLQEKIAEFQAQLATEVDAEKEELERELLALRESESERLDTVSQRIAKSTAEWTKLEATSEQHLTAAQEALAKLSAGTTAAVTKAQNEAARTLQESAAAASKAIHDARAAALAELNAALGAASAMVVERFTTGLTAKPSAVTAELDSRIARLDATAAKAKIPAPTAEATASAPATDTAITPPAADTAATEPEVPAPAPAPKRARKPKREEAPPAEPEVASVTHTPPAEPAPIPAETIPEVTPIAPVIAEPLLGNLAAAPLDAAPEPAPRLEAAPEAKPEEPAGPDPEGEAETARLLRRRSPKKVESDEQPALELDDSGSSSAASVAERVLSSDGATRVLITSYIGIGNRLFIRGEGPGLSWEKGVPLQFVSIGKWRWETNDASGPIQFKLYKNDDTECSALGAQALEPGHQLEVTAGF